MIDNLSKTMPIKSESARELLELPPGGCELAAR